MKNMKKMLMVMTVGMAFCSQAVADFVSGSKPAPVQPAPAQPAPAPVQSVPVSMKQPAAVPPAPSLDATQKAEQLLRMKKEAKELEKIRKEAERKLKEAEEARIQAQLKQAEMAAVAKEGQDIKNANIAAAKVIVDFTAQRFSDDKEKGRYDALYKKGMTWYTDEDLDLAISQLKFDVETLEQVGVDKQTVPGFGATMDTIQNRVKALVAERDKRAQLDKSTTGTMRRYLAKGARAAKAFSETEFGKAVFGFGETWALTEVARRGYVNETLLNMVAAQRGKEGFDAQAIRDKELARLSKEAEAAESKAQAAQLEAERERQAADWAASEQSTTYSEEELAEAAKALGEAKQSKESAMQDFNLDVD